MLLREYMTQRGWTEVEEPMFINDVEQPLLPEEAVQMPTETMPADTDPKAVYDFARATYGDFDGPVEFYIWYMPENKANEYITVAGKVFERPRTAGGTAGNRVRTVLAVIGAFSLVGGALFIMSRWAK